MKNSLLLIACWLILSFTSMAQPFNLLPTIPNYASNPHASALWKGIKTTNPPFTTILTGALSDEVFFAAMSYFHTQSPYYHNHLVLARTLTLLDSMLTNWNNNRYISNFDYTVEATYAYLLLKQNLPDSIPTNRKAIWESGITKFIAASVKKPLLYDSLKVGSVWLNGDIRFAIAVVLGGTAIGDTVSAKKACIVIENVMTQCLFADGGTHYYGYQNESFNYHTPTKKYLYLYWLLTQNPTVLNVLKGMNHYPLLMQHPIGKGFGEYIATPSWKPYYNSNTLEYAAAISAYLTNDPYSWTIGKNYVAPELAFIWKSGLSALPVPTNFILYDKNILGPRYRIANWGAVGTMRDMSSPLPEVPNETITPISTLMAGKQTFAGAYILNANATATTYPINAVFQAAALVVKTKTGKETDYNRGSVNSFLIAIENNSLTKTKTVYGLASRHSVVQAMNKTNFDGMQQWVFTQDRLVGMLELEAIANTTCYGLGSRFCFVSGRKSISGKYKPLVRLNDSTYQYGLLNFKIIQQDFKGKTDSVYYGIQGAAGDTLSNQLTLHDQLDSMNDKKITIPKGYRKKVLVEVTSSANAFAANSKVLPVAYPLYGFQFVENNNRKIRMVHNVSNASVQYVDTFYCNYSYTRILKSWQTSDSGVVGIKAGNTLPIQITIPAYGHVLLLNSGLTTDTAQGYNTFDSVFVGSTILPVQDMQLEGRSSNCSTTIRLTVKVAYNILQYQLQGSQDGTSFKDITTIPPHNATTDKLETYTIAVPPSNNNLPFYRIQATDKDGSNSYSKVIYVPNDCGTSDALTVYPNPTIGNTFQVQYKSNLATSKSTIRILNTLGKLEWQKEISVVKGLNVYTISSQSLTMGQHYIQLTTSSGAVITKTITIGR